MSDVSPPAVAPRAALPWSEDVIFELMRDPARRRIVKSLARGAGRTASDLRGVTGKRLDATIKDCAALVAQGFLVSVKDGQDGRKRCYSLAPAVPLAQTPTGWEMDFGCCLLRLPG
jgi:hypothetical protein